MTILDAEGRLTPAALVDRPRPIVFEVLMEDYANLLQAREELGAQRGILAGALETMEWSGFRGACPICGERKDDESLTGGHDGGCTLYLALIRSGWRKRECSICRGDVPAAAENPLCPNCEGTARAAGKASVEAMRFAKAEGDLAPENVDAPIGGRR